MLCTACCVIVFLSKTFKKFLKNIIVFFHVMWIDHLTQLRIRELKNVAQLADSEDVISGNLTPEYMFKLLSLT